jgi:hypothetical protein
MGVLFVTLYPGDDGKDLASEGDQTLHPASGRVQLQIDTKQLRGAWKEDRVGLRIALPNRGEELIIPWNRVASARLRGGE